MDLQILFEGKVIRTQRLDSRLVDMDLIVAKRRLLIAAIENRELTIAQALRAEMRVFEPTAGSNA